LGHRFHWCEARRTLPYAEPFTFLTVRFAIVTALLVLICLASDAPWPRRNQALHAIVAGALIHGAYLGGVFWAIDRGMAASVSALITSLQPLLTALLAVPILGEHVAPRHWIGLGLGLAGVTLVLSPSLQGDATGITIATFSVSLISLFGFTLGAIYQKRFATGTDLRSGAVFQYVGALAVTGLAALLTEQGRITWSPELVFAMVWLVLVLSIGAITLLMLLIRENAVSQVASLFYLVPVVVALMAWLMFDELLSPIQLVGMAIVVVGVALAGWTRAARPLSARVGRV